MSWDTYSEAGLWIFTHPDGRQIEALPNRHVTNPSILRRALVDALNDHDNNVTAGAIDL